MYVAGFYTYSIFALLFWETRRSDSGVGQRLHRHLLLFLLPQARRSPSQASLSWSFTIDRLLQLSITVSVHLVSPLFVCSSIAEMSTLSIPQFVPPASDDAEQLRKAFSGWGTNEELIIFILYNRSSAHRHDIQKAYAVLYGEDLLKALVKELLCDFEKIVLLWVLDHAERDAVLAYDSARRWGPGDRALIEIACDRSSDDLFAARRAYHARYKRSLGRCSPCQGRFQEAYCQFKGLTNLLTLAELIS